MFEVLIELNALIMTVKVIIKFILQLDCTVPLHLKGFFICCTTNAAPFFPLERLVFSRQLGQSKTDHQITSEKASEMHLPEDGWCCQHVCMAITTPLGIFDAIL